MNKPSKFIIISGLIFSALIVASGFQLYSAKAVSISCIDGFSVSCPACSPVGPNAIYSCGDPSGPIGPTYENGVTGGCYANYQCADVWSSGYGVSGCTVLGPNQLQCAYSTSAGACQIDNGSYPLPLPVACSSLPPPTSQSPQPPQPPSDGPDFTLQLNPTTLIPVSVGDPAPTLTLILTPNSAYEANVTLSINGIGGTLYYPGNVPVTGPDFIIAGQPQTFKFIPDDNSAGTYSISATGVGEVTRNSNTVTFVVNSVPAIQKVTVSCPTQVTINQTVPCSATVKGVGAFSSAVDWSIISPVGPGTGSFSPLTTTNGVATNYTAPGTVMTVAVKATSEQNPAKSDVAHVQIVSPPLAGCSTLTYNAATSGFSTSTAGPTDPNSITLAPTDQVFYTYVDYGEQYADSIQSPTAAGAPSCTFDSADGTNGWLNNGTVAIFKCTASNAGSYTYSTGVNGGTSDDDCPAGPQQIGVAGGVTVSAPIPGGGPSVSNPNPNPVNPGEATTITATGGCGGNVWTTVSQDGGTITAPSNTGTTYSPTDSEQDAYTVTVTDSCGNTASTTVNVWSPICDLTPNPAVVTPPQSSDLSWTCRYATYCAINGTDGYSSGPLSGSSGAVTVTPSKTTTYTLVCTGNGSGPGNSTQNTATVSVSGSNIHETNP